jgi:hypothetical protein
MTCTSIDYTVDEVLVGSGMGLSLIVGHWRKNSASKLKRIQLNVCTVYGVLFSPCD